MTAAVMKMVVNGFAGAGTIALGGFDYHDGTRATGETRNFDAGGVCIGACLEYAKRVGVPLMVYVFSDGSLSSTNMIDTSAAGRGKFGWQGDNSSVAASFFLVYNPTARPVVCRGDDAEPDRLLHRGRLGQRLLQPGGECRESAGEHSHSQLHGLARCAGELRQHHCQQWTGNRPGFADRLRADREREDRRLIGYTPRPALMLNSVCEGRRSPGRTHWMTVREVFSQLELASTLHCSRNADPPVPRSECPGLCPAGRAGTGFCVALIQRHERAPL